MSDRLQLTLFIFLTFTTLIIPAIYTYHSDPFQIFQKRDNGLETLYSNQRIQNAGLIRTHLTPQSPFKTMIIGTSHSENFRPSFVEQTLKDSAVLKLAMSRSQPKTKGIVAKAALRKGLIEHAIWEVYHNYDTSIADTQNQKHSFPDYLYDETLTNDWKYLFNYTTVTHGLGIEGKTLDYDSYGVWYDRAINLFKRYSNATERRKKRIDGIAHRRNRDGYITYDLTQYDRNYPAIDKWLTQIIKDNPDVKHTIFFPPHTLAHYAEIKHGTFLRRMFMYRYILEQIKDLKNVRAYGFDTQPWITADIGNYKDAGHYSKEGRHRLTLNNITEYETKWIEMINAYEEPPL